MLIPVHRPPKHPHKKEARSHPPLPRVLLSPREIPAFAEKKPTAAGWWFPVSAPLVLRHLAAEKKAAVAEKEVAAIGVQSLTSHRWPAWLRKKNRFSDA